MQVSTITSNDESLQKSCILCTNSKIIFDSTSHELICAVCGAVIDQGDSLVMEPDFGKSDLNMDKMGIRTRDSVNTPLAYHDMGLSTSISKSNYDANGGRIDPSQQTTMYRLRRQDKFMLNRARQRNLTIAFFYLAQIKSKLNLSDTAHQHASLNYRKAMNYGLAKGRSIKGLIIASTYAACKELNLPKTIEEIARTIDADPFFARRCYRLLARKFSWESPKVEPETYLNKFANNLDVKGKVFKRALEIMAVMKGNHLFLGKNPRAMAAAAIHVACEEEKVNLSMMKISNASDVSLVSIRKRAIDIRSVLTH